MRRVAALSAEMTENRPGPSDGAGRYELDGVFPIGW